jgi:ABC-type antimicrobial peptide transport system permease subunit
MLNNYLKIALRNLLKNKIYSFLNISGLAVGMTVALLIALWVLSEFSYDKFIPDHDKVYQVKQNGRVGNLIKTSRSLPLPLSDALRKEIPEIEYVAETDWIDAHGLMVGKKKFVREGAIAGADFLKILQYPLLKGNAANVLEDPYSIVLTESMAKALFGDADPMNQLVIFDNENNLKVTGVLKDLPKNSSLYFEFIVPFSYWEQTSSWVKKMRPLWEDNSFQMFVKLKPNVDNTRVSAKIKNIINDHSPEMRQFKSEVILQPFTELHLYNRFENGKQVGGYIEYVHIFSIIGILVLLIACINFINLSTARSAKRSVEVGIRKAIGSQRTQLIFQFLTESILIVFLAFIFSMLLLVLLLPYFNTLTGTVIHLPFDKPAFWSCMFAYIFATGLLAGARPAFYLSSFHPAKVLKGTILSAKGATSSRKVLVVLQFTCSIALIISTLIIYQQIDHAQNRPMGYQMDRLLETGMGRDLNRNYDALKNDLLKTGMVKSITKSSCPLSDITHYPGISNWPGKSTDMNFINAGLIEIPDDYFKVLGMELKSGKMFSTGSNPDTTAVVVNESAVKQMNLKYPLNQLITIGRDHVVHIVGVVNDAVLESPFDPVMPILYAPVKKGSDAGFVIYRLAEDVKTEHAIALITPVFNLYNPAYPYNYSFADDEYKYKFGLEQLVGRLAAIFSGLAIFISCLGLFGLAAYVAEQRTKEIGIRKVLGASVSQLWLLLCKDFIFLISISCIIASPLAFYFLQNWLQKYTYRISIGADVFMLATLAALIITIVTISFQAIKAATTNPVKNLRTE